MTSSQRFLIVAGEASGDMYGADVARSLFRRFPGCEVFGLGGEKMRKAGVALESDIRHTAVVGPFEVVSQLGALYRVFRRLAERVAEAPPAAAILIDFPDFNLRLAKRIRKTGCPVVYYISPQVWAWRPGRVQEIRQLVDKMLVIFPFEEEIYQRAGVDAEFVGHPLVDVVRATKTKQEFCRDYGLDPARPIVAMLPGSRPKEVRYILPTLCESAERITSERQASGSPLPQFVIPAAPNLDKRLIAGIVGDRAITVVTGETYNVVRHARAAIVASGTATLETALLGTPEVIVYRISGATWFLGKFLLKVRLFGIVNIILGEEVVPELFQDKFTPELVARTTIRLMDDVWVQSKIRGSYETLRRELRGGKVADRVVDAVARLLPAE
ncbi:MAG TPA: lipid-A-disaccharide synthase [Terriglobia bacterium]|nr:lipid-A-disaccharide synthase [Terriglobia bacterium]